jgi:hypothetical protein
MTKKSTYRWTVFHENVREAAKRAVLLCMEGKDRPDLTPEQRADGAAYDWGLTWRRDRDGDTIIFRTKWKRPPASANYDRDLERPYTVVGHGLKPPSSNWSDIQCPFCGHVSRAYWWSIFGGGKLCEGKGCHAKFNSWGNAYPRKAKEPRA